MLPHASSMHQSARRLGPNACLCCAMFVSHLQKPAGQGNMCVSRGVQGAARNRPVRCLAQPLLKQPPNPTPRASAALDSGRGVGQRPEEEAALVAVVLRRRAAAERAAARRAPAGGVAACAAAHAAARHRRRHGDVVRVGRCCLLAEVARPLAVLIRGVEGRLKALHRHHHAADDLEAGPRPRCLVCNVAGAGCWDVCHAAWGREALASPLVVPRVRCRCCCQRGGVSSVCYWLVVCFVMLVF